MCGITGYFNINNQFKKDLFSNANNIIKHRGPDDFGFITLNSSWKVETWKDEFLNDFNDNNVIGAFGFRRLSIIDLSYKGHQPMSDISNNLWIVFNGEIYNYIELREELKKLGYKFISDTDTEVILYAYKEWGTKCISKFNGMWSFCILDKSEKKLFCARDHFGIKPFYFYYDKANFIFGSEIKQILELLPDSSKKVNKRLIFDFLTLGSYGNETHETYFEEIFKINPGSYIEVDLSNTQQITYKETVWWELPSEEINIDENKVYEHIYELLLDSVMLRLRSDVPQATALSGGLDSSVIVSLVNELQHGNKEVNKVFTMISNDPKIDDKYYADLVLKNFPVTSFQKNFEENASLNELNKVLWHQEEPIQTASIFGSWELYKFFREKNITVTLDGQGADELLGGYNWYPFRKHLLDSLRSFGVKYTYSQIKEISKFYHSSKYKIICSLIYEFLIDTFKEKTGLYYRLKLKKPRELINSDFYSSQKKASYMLNKGYLKKGLVFKSNFKKDSYELIRHTNLTGILRQVDRNSMAFSVESRLPFLDHRFVEFVYSLSPKLLIKDGSTKYALRKAMVGKLPDEVLWRKNKISFKMPEYEILKRNKEFVKEALMSLKNDPIINWETLEGKIDYYLTSPKTYNNVLWRFFIYALWKQEFKIN